MSGHTQNSQGRVQGDLEQQTLETTYTHREQTRPSTPLRARAPCPLGRRLGRPCVAWTAALLRALTPAAPGSRVLQALSAAVRAWLLGQPLLTRRPGVRDLMPRCPTPRGEAGGAGRCPPRSEGTLASDAASH